MGDTRNSGEAREGLVTLNGKRLFKKSGGNGNACIASEAEEKDSRSILRSKTLKSGKTVSYEPERWRELKGKTTKAGKCKKPASRVEQPYSPHSKSYSHIGLVDVQRMAAEERGEDSPPTAIEDLPMFSTQLSKSSAEPSKRLSVETDLNSIPERQHRQNGKESHTLINREHSIKQQRPELSKRRDIENEGRKRIRSLSQWSSNRVCKRREQVAAGTTYVEESTVGLLERRNISSEEWVCNSESEKECDSRSTVQKKKKKSDNDDQNFYDGKDRFGNHGNVVIRACEGVDIADLLGQDETAKRRERRRAQKEREKESKRRRREGMTTNVLTVNERSGKPYGFGMEDWKADLRLLSRKLNPAILNINQQPEGAIQEISEWIQHSWHYTAPVRFKIVKDIIARAIRVRRSDIWKKIDNDEQKPEDLSDLSWSTLRKLRNSPAHRQKSEDCKRANASRVNFGRTGPSGVVGVKRRLEDTLHRSPEPEEIDREMHRDKGYGGRSKRNKEKVGIQASGGGPSMTLLLRPAEDKDSEEDSSDSDSVEGYPILSHGKDGCRDVGNQKSVLEEDIFSHPTVLQMRKTIETLQAEKQLRASSSGHTDAKYKTTAEAYIKKKSTRTKKKAWHVIDDATDDDDDEGGQPCISRSTRRRVIYD